MELLTRMPCWYLMIGVAWSIFQGARGVVEQRRNYQDREKNNNWEPWEKIIILYIHDFFFRFICTMAGFFALYVCYFLATSGKGILELSSGASVLVVFSFLIGVIGVGGQLHYVILMGRWPPR